MKKIALFPDGNIGVVDTDLPHAVKINGKEPIGFVEYTEENIKKYSPLIKERKKKISQKVAINPSEMKINPPTNK